MRHDNWYNEEYMNKRRSEVINVANSIISGKSGIIEGARKLCGLRYEVSEDEFDDDFTIFVAVDSETDHLPVGQERENWSLDALEKKDKEIKDYESQVSEEMIAACRKLIERFENEQKAS